MVGLIALIFFGALSSSADFQAIRVIWTSDLHSQLLPTPDFASPGVPRRRLGGWNNLKKLIQGQQTPATILLDCGDFGFGSPEGDSSQGRVAITLMNRIGYDAVTLGARDFCGGLANVELLARFAGFPVLADPMLNVVLNRQTPLFRPYLIKDIKGVKVGIIGLTDPEIPALNRPIDVAGIVIDDPLTQLHRYLPAVIAESAEVIIVFGHITVDDGMNIAESVPGVHLILCSGNPDKIEGQLPRVGKGVVAVSGVFGQRIGIADILFHKTKRQIYQIATQVLNVVPEEKADTELQAILLNRLDETVAYSEEEFPPDETGKIKLGLVIAEAIKKATGADITVLPVNVIEGGVTTGEITIRDLFNTVPYKERLRLLSLPETLLTKVLVPVNLDRNIICPAVAGADLFVTGDTLIWPRLSEVTQFRLRKRNKDIYKLVTTETWLKHSMLTEQGKFLPDNLTDLWLKFVSEHQKIKADEPPKLYLATLGIAREPSKQLININTASTELLCQLPGIGPKTAEKIIQYRESQGRFRSIEEIMNVKGIGPKKFEQIKDLITVK